MVADEIRRAAAGAVVVGGQVAGGTGAGVHAGSCPGCRVALVGACLFLGVARADVPARAREPLCKDQADRSERGSGRLSGLIRVMPQEGPVRAVSSAKTRESSPRKLASAMHRAPWMTAAHGRTCILFRQSSPARRMFAAGAASAMERRGCAERPVRAGLLTGKVLAVPFRREERGTTSGYHGAQGPEMDLGGRIPLVAASSWGDCRLRSWRAF